MRRSLVFLAVLGAVALMTGPAVADPETSDPTPPTPAAAPSGVGALTTVSVGTAEEYCDALTDLSIDPAGPHVIDLTASFSLVGASCVTDPTYTGTQALTINGNGFSIDGGDVSRILDFQSTAGLTINDLTATNGFTTGSGGAIENDGNITVNGSVFDGNNAEDDGGAIDSEEDATITQSTFTNNNADDGDGGAIDTSEEGSSLVATKSTFSGNSATGDGGALEAEEDVTLINSTVEGNTGEEDVINAESGDITLVYVTISGNTIPAGEGVLDTDGDPAGTLTLFGTVIANTIGGDNCEDGDFSAVVSSYTHSSDASCGLAGPGDVENAPDPQLGALGDNGGPTPTMLPASTSPLLDQIPVAECDAGEGIADDQRGVTRPQGTGCDIGAVEVEVEVVTPLPIVLEPTFTG